MYDYQYAVDDILQELGITQHPEAMKRNKPIRIGGFKGGILECPVNETEYECLDLLYKQPNYIKRRSVPYDATWAAHFMPNGWFLSHCIQTEDSMGFGVEVNFSGGLPSGVYKTSILRHTIASNLLSILHDDPGLPQEHVYEKKDRLERNFGLPLLEIKHKELEFLEEHERKVLDIVPQTLVALIEGCYVEN